MRIQDRWNYIEMRHKSNLRRKMPLAGCMNSNYMFPIPPPAGVFQHVHVSPLHNKVHFPWFSVTGKEDFTGVVRWLFRGPLTIGQLKHMFTHQHTSIISRWCLVHANEPSADCSLYGWCSDATAWTVPRRRTQLSWAYSRSWQAAADSFDMVLSPTGQQQESNGVHNDDTKPEPDFKCYHRLI